MARIETDPNYSSPTFSRATAGTDLFKKEDVQALAAAVSTHDHSSGKGAVLAAGSIPTGSITSAMIADGTVDTADLKDGAVTSAKILDGTIATADHADASVTNAKLASDTARANLLTNGGFEVWQRGNGPFTTTGAYCADRWELQIAGGDALSVSRDTANAAAGSSACVACTYTRGAGGSGLSNPTKEQVAQLKGRTVSFSVRVRTSVPNAVRTIIYDGVGYTYGGYHSGSGAYETLTVTHAITSTATLLDLKAIFDASCTAYIDNAMLVVGSVAADYAPLHPADDLARCLRYYQRHETSGGYGFMGPGQALSATAGVYFLPMQGRTAVAPTITFTAPSTFTATNGVGSAVTGATAISLNPGTNPISTMCISVSGMSALTVGMASWLLSNNAAAAVIAEGNP